MQKSQLPLETLVTMCQSGDPEQQVFALYELSEYGDASSLTAVQPLLASPAWRVRQACVVALEYLGPQSRQPIGPVLLPFLTDVHPEVRSTTAFALGTVSYPEAKEPLRRLLHHDPAWSVRTSAALALAHYADQALLDDLDQALAEDEHPIVQEYAAFALGVLAPPTFIPKLETYLSANSGQVRIRNALLSALYHLGAPGSFQRLIDLIETEEVQAVSYLLAAVDGRMAFGTPPSFTADAPYWREALLRFTQRSSLPWEAIQESYEHLLGEGT